MSNNKKSIPQKTTSKKTPWIIIIPIIIAIFILIPAGGFAFAATQESHDSFCGSCHTEPESTYLDRSLANHAVDLASYHSTEDTRCIDCHSGKGVSGRIKAEFLGAQNAIKWYTGTAVQPAPLTKPIADSNCLKCHQEITQRNYVPENKTLRDLGEAQNGHWHLFLSRWQRQSKDAGSCVSCHNGHTTDGDGTLLYLNDQKLNSVCDSCHRVLGDD